MFNLKDGDVAECKIFECPVNGGRLCCCSCAKNSECDEHCLNHPNKCNEAVLIK